MNDQARAALDRVIRAYGPGICNTPRSCELFVRQECGAYPPESHALVEALRHGIAAELLHYKSEEPWPAFADGLSGRLHAKAGLAAEQGAWAIDTWAKALGRHPETWLTAPEVLAAQPASSGGTVSAATLRRAMTGIVGLGGALGGALGAMMVPGVLLITAASYKMPIVNQPLRHGAKMDVWLLVALALLIVGAIGASGGGLGAALGWRYGKGDRAPWAGFNAAFGAAFTSSALGGYFCGVFGWFFSSFLAGFGAATTMARRGGFER